ncbi:hypothetical protein ACEQ8H_006922 [Pleosporales sp. CAS-2024a]
MHLWSKLDGKSNKAHREAFVIPTRLPQIVHRRGGSSDESCPSGDSSPEQSPKPRKEVTPTKFAVSRKTGFATIRTDSTDTQPEFESDAFAVLMPTTRLPILEYTKPYKQPASAAAQAEALKTYQEKARQNREKNNSQGVHVPSRIVSYDYACRNVSDQHVPKETSTEVPTTAGSFPVSPPVPQHAWARSGKAVEVNVERPRNISGLRTAAAAAAPPTLKDTTKTASATSCYRVYRPDSTAGASRSPTSSTTLPPSITVRIKPRTKITAQDVSPIQKESNQKLYTRTVGTTSIQNSRDSSPVKSMPNFTRHNSTEGDSLFGYKSKHATVTMSNEAATSSGAEKSKPPSPNTSDSEKAKGKSKASTTPRPKTSEKTAAASTTPTKDTPLKRTLAQRWPWLRPAGQSIPKPTTTPVVFTAPAAAPPTRPTSGYMDPFQRLATPPVSLRTPARPPTPLTKTPPKPSPSLPTANTRLHNTARHNSTAAAAAAAAPATRPSPTGKFDSGFAQIQTFAVLLAKACLVVYAVVALWYVLDALRSAIYTLGVPFRIVRWVAGWVWFVGGWVVGMVGTMVRRRM